MSKVRYGIKTGYTTVIMFPKNLKETEFVNLLHGSEIRLLTNDEVGTIERENAPIFLEGSTATEHTLESLILEREQSMKLIEELQDALKVSENKAIFTPHDVKEI